MEGGRLGDKQNPPDYFRLKGTTAPFDLKINHRIHQGTFVEFNLQRNVHW